MIGETLNCILHFKISFPSPLFNMYASTAEVAVLCHAPLTSIQCIHVSSKHFKIIHCGKGHQRSIESQYTTVVPWSIRMIMGAVPCALIPNSGPEQNTSTSETSAIVDYRGFLSHHEGSWIVPMPILFRLVISIEAHCESMDTLDKTINSFFIQSSTDNIG